MLLTERCDNYCLMCSQPPKTATTTGSWTHAFDLIRLLPRRHDGIAFTGGEPTLYGERLIDLLKLARNLLPFAGVHCSRTDDASAMPTSPRATPSVANPHHDGRASRSTEPNHRSTTTSCRRRARSTRPSAGILNLAQLGQRIEIRVVIHKQTAPQLPEIAEFIARNLTFVDQVALMGLEMIGFARANIDDVWIDPVDYQTELTEAVAARPPRIEP